MKFKNGPRSRCCACHQRRLARGASPNSLLVLPAPAPSRVTLRKRETSLAALPFPLPAAASQTHTHGPPLHCPIAERVFITTDGGRPVTLDIRLPTGCAVAAADVDMPRVAVAAADGQMWLFEVSLPPSELFFDEAETAQAQHCVVLQLEASVASLRLSGVQDLVFSGAGDHKSASLVVLRRLADGSSALSEHNVEWPPESEQSVGEVHHLPHASVTAAAATQYFCQLGAARITRLWHGASNDPAYFLCDASGQVLRLTPKSGGPNRGHVLLEAHASLETSVSGLGWLQEEVVAVCEDGQVMAHLGETPQLKYRVESSFSIVKALVLPEVICALDHSTGTLHIATVADGKMIQPLFRVEEAPSDCEDVVAGVNHVIILDVEGRLLQIDIKCLADCKLVGASDMSLSKGIALLNEASGRVRDLEGHISTLDRHLKTINGVIQAVAGDNATPFYHGQILPCLLPPGSYGSPCVRFRLRLRRIPSTTARDWVVKMTVQRPPGGIVAQTQRLDARAWGGTAAAYEGVLQLPTVDSATCLLPMVAKMQLLYCPLGSDIEGFQSAGVATTIDVAAERLYCLDFAQLSAPAEEETPHAWPPAHAAITEGRARYHLQLGGVRWPMKTVIIEDEGDSSEEGGHTADGATEAKRPKLDRGGESGVEERLKDLLARIHPLLPEVASARPTLHTQLALTATDVVFALIRLAGRPEAPVVLAISPGAMGDVELTLEGPFREATAVAGALMKTRDCTLASRPAFLKEAKAATLALATDIQVALAAQGDATALDLFARWVWGNSLALNVVA